MSAILITDLKWRNDREQEDCERFVALTQRFSYLNWFPTKNQWQIDVKVPTGSVISFWPHKLKMVNHRTYTSIILRDWSEAEDYLDKILGTSTQNTDLVED